MNHCHIVRDLLPLYIEDMTSQGSTEFILDHINRCPQCREEYRRMQHPVRPDPSPHEEWKTAFKKKERQRKLRTLVLWVLCILLVLGLCGIPLYRYSQRYEEITYTTTILDPQTVPALCPLVVPTAEELDFMEKGASLFCLTQEDQAFPREDLEPYADTLIPHDAHVGEIFGNRICLSIDYFYEGQRILLAYRDVDEDGAFDRLEKFVTPNLNVSNPSYYVANYDRETVTTLYEFCQPDN